MALIRGRKAYYFSLSVIILLVLVSFIVATRSDHGFLRQSHTDANRLFELNSFVLSVQKDASAAVSVAGLRSFMALDKEILMEQERFFEDHEEVQAYLQELIINGTIHNGDMNSSFLIEESGNSTLKAWAAKVSELASDVYRFELSIEWEELEVWQEDPWLVHLGVRYRIRADDEFTDSHWNITSYSQAAIPLSKLNDPIYTMGTNKNYFQTITPTNITDLDYDILEHINQYMYIQTNLSPNFLNRLIGNFTANNNITGIESLVHVPSIDAVGIIYDKRSIVDWHYLYDQSTAMETYNHSSPTWLRIDCKHAEYYDFECE